MIRLELDPPVHKRPNVNSVAATVTIADGRRTPAGISITFKLDGGREWHRQDTDDNGQVSVLIENIPDGGFRGDGRLFVEVRRTGVAESDRKEVRIQMPAPEQTRVPDPVATSVSEIRFTKAVDHTNATTMRYVLTWTILDQSGRPIAGTVTRLFDGDQHPVGSEENRLGVCVDAVAVVGFGREIFYTVIPTTGEPRIITLKGPEMPAPTLPTPPAPQLHSLDLKSDAGTAAAGTMRYRVLMLAKGRVPNTTIDVPMPGITGHWVCSTESGDVTTSPDGSVWFEVTLSQPAPARLTMISGTVSAQIDLEGPARPAPTPPAVPATLELILPRCANIDGSFLVTAITKRGNNPQAGINFLLSSVEALTVTGLDHVVLGQGHSFELSTGTEGRLTFLLTFRNPVKTQVTFSLPNGVSQSKLLVK